MSDLAKAIALGQHAGTPLRVARATVVSSTIGTTVVQPDGSSGAAAQVTVSNYAHTQSLAAGVVVDVLFVGNHGFVLGAF